MQIQLPQRQTFLQIGICSLNQPYQIQYYMSATYIETEMTVREAERSSDTESGWIKRYLKNNYFISFDNQQIWDYFSHHFFKPIVNIFIFATRECDIMVCISDGKDLVNFPELIV